MNKIKRTKTISETAYAANDGKEFPYEAMAREHEANILNNKIGCLEVREITPPFSNTVIKLYRINSSENENLLKKFFEIRGIVLEDIDDLENAEWIGYIKYNNGEIETVTINQIKDQIDQFKDTLENL